jgi:hypothetical protein
MRAEAETVERLSVAIRDLQKEVMELEARAGAKEGADEEALPLPASEEACVVASTRRWGQIKTLGEARKVLAMLFETAVASRHHADSWRAVQGGQASGGGALAHKPQGTAAHAPQHGAAGLAQGAVRVAVPGAKPKPKPSKKVVVVEEEDDDDMDEEDDSSDQSDSDDSDYDPLNSPSRRARGNKAPRNSKEEAERPVVKGRGGRKGDRGEKRVSLEDEIDALLSDADDEQEAPPKKLEEPITQFTVPELKAFLKQRKLPLSGKKDVLVQRLRDHVAAEAHKAAGGAEGGPTPTPSGQAAAAPSSASTSVPPVEPLVNVRATPAPPAPAPVVIAAPVQEKAAGLSSATPAVSTAPVSKPSKVVEAEVRRLPLGDLKNRLAGTQAGHSLIKQASSFKSVNRSTGPLFASKAQRVPIQNPGQPQAKSGSQGVKSTGGVQGTSS